MKKINSLSTVLAVFNEEKNIETCLDSVKDIADEIVVVDGSSTDKTIEIAKKFKAKVIVTNNPPIFHINKQKAVNNATCDWVLQLDADEVVTKDLCREIMSAIQNKDAKQGYFVARKNYFMGKWMKKGGMYPDYVIRLFKRTRGKFPCKSVHEQIEIDGEVGYLEKPMIHIPYPTFGEYLRKADTYTSLTRDELIEKRMKINFFSIVTYLFYYPFRTFFSLYIRHQGVTDGWLGFVWALFSGLHYPWAYIKYLKYKSVSQ
jgi:glycosyltransferase involved in cell wall biosynthesis